ncbi:phosphatidyl serine synthase-domain-containing protein [Gongronella butleri]|nr:phosphatidyl serine synthase-domain-containing protein [Gongronella butleri]
MKERNVEDPRIAANSAEELFHPHTLTALLVMLAWLFYAGLRTNHEDTETSVKLGIMASIWCFVFIGMLQFRDGPFVRPSVPFWRAVLSLSVIYQLFLVFMLFMNKNDARRFMTYFDPNLGIELPERSYADNCETSWSNIQDQLDIFVLAHALGWYGKALIVRDYYLCWILSVAFELCEYSLQHQLNNFAECWWDHWILDVLLCNWAGLYLGMKTCQYLEVKHYSWVGFRQIKSLRGKAKRAVQQFTPYDWTRFEWKPSSSPKNYFGMVALMLVFLQCELNCFYLKYMLWVPPEHPLNTYRLILVFFFALPGARDVYQYLSDRNTNRLGAHAWLFISNIMTESLICLKFSENEFHTPAPMVVKVSWSIFFAIVLVIFPLWRFSLLPNKDAQQASQAYGTFGDASSASSSSSFSPPFPLEDDTVYCTVLLLTTRVYGTKAFLKHVCIQLNMLYLIDWLLRALDVVLFYQFLSTHWHAASGYLFSTWMLALNSILLTLIIVEPPVGAPQGPVLLKSGRFMSGEHWASIYSQFMFSWVDEMMKKGWTQTLDDGDLLELPAENRAASTLAYYRWGYRVNLVWSVLRAFRRPLGVQFVYSMVWSVSMFGPPFFLNKIIKFIEKGADADTPVLTAFFYALGLFATSCAQSLAYQQALYIGRVLGIRLQSIVIGEVYGKALRRRDTSDTAKPEDQVAAANAKSNVNNLLSVDAQKLGDAIAYIFYFYCFPLQTVICVWALYQLLGVASLYGVFVMVLAQPVTYVLSRRFQKQQQNVLRRTDKRIKLMNELLNAIRIVKFFAWERQFRQRIVGARAEELKALKARLVMFMWMSNVFFLVPVLTMVAVFYAYTRDHILTAATSFSALSLFNTFKGIFDELPAITSFALQGTVSVRRVEAFLREQDVDANATATTHPSVTLGFVENAAFTWHADDDQANGSPTLKNINLSFPMNKLSLICGPTGAGKTTLLASLLGETHCVAGAAILPRKRATDRIIGGSASGIAYVAQTAWLQNLSIRDNILFGQPFDPERYARVLYMTALTRDLDIMEHNDRTQVGEKGISLSGGQKQRVAIARAVYSQAEIVILDDCLSAVDAHTAKHIYQHCLMGDLMRGRTVLLVTHHVGLCIRGADYVVAMHEGTIAAAGTPKDVMAAGVLGDEFSLLDESTDEDDDDSSKVIPSVPKNAYSDIHDDNGAGTLTKDEARAEGGVKFAVYRAYVQASGGYAFWVLILLMFGFAQASVVGQDYWIKIWSSAYSKTAKSTIFSATAFFLRSASLQTSPQDDDTMRRVDDSVNVSYYLAIYVLIGLVALIMNTFRYLTLFSGSIRASTHLHSQLLDRILRAKARFFDVTPLGRILNRFSSDLETVDHAVGPSLSFLLYNGIACIYVVVLITVVSPMFIVPGSVIALVFWHVGRYYLRSSRDMKRLNSVSRSPIYVQFNESIQGVATIRAFGAQRRFINDNFQKVDTNNRPFIWMWATNRWLHCRVDILGAAVGLFTAIVLLLSRDWIDAGLAGLSLAYSLTFTHHILWIVRSYAINEMNCVSIERVEEYMSVDQEDDQGAVARAQWPESGQVTFEDVEVQYAPDTPVVLHGISFQTKPGEKVGIVGRTGSGKSTITLTLFRFLSMNRGKITIDGVDISSLALDDLRSRLTIVPQEPVLFSGTLRTNLDPFDAHDDATLWAALKRSHLIDAAGATEDGRSLALDDPVLENGQNWSHGQRQLIALARALVKKSTVVVLDEATSSVDFDTDKKIQDTIRSEFSHATLLCIAHRLRTIVDYDRVLVLDQGKVMEFDTPYNLMTKHDGIFKQMCARSGEQQELFVLAKAKHDATTASAST